MEVIVNKSEWVRLNPPEELRTRLLNQTGGWQMLPDIAVKALAMARNPECSIREFASVVERDPKLATEILRITNSAFYAARNPILNLKQAVTRLGFAHCRNVILAASLGSALRRLTMAEAWMQMVLWRHSVITGTIAIALNKTLELGFIGEEFTAGLVHDVGRSLLGVIAPNHFATADPLDFEETGDFLQQERDILRTDHCELGAWFIAHNGLPNALIEVVGLHHSPGLARTDRKLVAATAVADHMANHLQRQGTADGYEPTDNPALTALLDAGSVDGPEFCRSAHSIMSAAQREANSSNGPFSLS